MNLRFIITFLFFVSLKCMAQQFYVKKYTVKEGLAGNEVQCMMQDSRGFLWLSTNDGGLSRYDGKNFINYSMEEGLASYIKWISFEDSTGRLWMSNKLGICSFDGKKFEEFPIENNPKNVWIAQVLKTKKNKIWFVKGTGIYQLDDMVWRKLNILQNNPENHFVDVLEMDDGSLIVNLYDSLVHWTSPNKYTTIARTNSENHIFFNFTKSKDHIWFNTRNHLYLLKDYKLIPVHDDVLGHKNICKVYEDCYGRLWVGTEGKGFYVFTGNNVTTNFSSQLNNEWVTDILEDNEGNIWACASDGLFKIKASFIDVFKIDSLNKRRVMCSFKDHNGNIIFGCDYNVIYSWNNNGTAVRDSRIEKIARNHYRYINLISEDEHGRIWVADNQGALYRKANDKAQDVSEKFHITRAINAMQYDGSAHCMYVSADFGLMKINDDDTYSVDTLFTYGEDRIMALSLDLSGDLWIALEKGVMLVKNKKEIRPVNNMLGINHVSISNIFFTHEKKLWISTYGMGIYCFKKNNENDWALNLHITTTNGLMSDFIYDMSFDNNKRLWVSTLSGLCSVNFSSLKDGQQFSVRKYGEEEGFNSINYENSNLETDANRNIWFGTRNYVAKIRSDEINEDTLPPQIHIEDVQLFNSGTDWKKYSSSFTSFFNLPVNPVMSYNKNDITIQYNAISFADEKNIIYSYQLEGADKEWIEAGSNIPVKYANLLPGNYTFKVRAKKTFSSWSDPVFFSFIITPPWWKTWWFSILVAAAIAAIAYTLYRFRLNQILKLASIRNKIASDLHDDIGSTLNSISIYSEVAKKNNAQHDEALEMIGDSSRKVIDAMSDIVWTINPDNDSFAKIIFRMKSLAYNLLRAKKIEFIFQADEALNGKKLSLEERRNFYLIFKEAVNNLVKYSNATSAGITLLNEKDCIILKIQDNGVGFDTSQDNVGNGLKNMKRRANEMKANLKIGSGKGHGIQIELILKA